MRTAERINYMVTKRDWRSIYHYTCDECGAEAVWDTGDPNDGHLAFRESGAREWVNVGRGLLSDLANFCSLECLQKGVAKWTELPLPNTERGGA